MRATLLLLALCLPACDDGEPAVPPGQFACGVSFCDVASQFCVLATADGGAQTAGCTPANACTGGVPACACVMYQCQGTCSQGDDGSITLTCAH